VGKKISIHNRNEKPSARSGKKGFLSVMGKERSLFRKSNERRPPSKGWKERFFSDRRMIASLYDRRAKYYDAVVHILSLNMDVYYRKTAIQRLRLRPGNSVLDLGCGTGLDLPLLSQKVGPKGWVAAYDLSCGMLNRANQRIDCRKYSNITLVRGNAAELPFQDKSFDSLFCNYLLSTVPAIKVIEEAFRVARPGATMVFADDRLPSGWFASPVKALWEFLQGGYFNCALPGIEVLRNRLSSVQITNHHGGLIFILSGILNDSDI